MEELSAISKDIWAFIQAWYWLPLLLVYIATIITILIENRNPAKTIAWILVIVFLPFIGLIIYFFFGQKFKKEKIFQRLDQQQKTKIEERWNTLMEDSYRQIENYVPLIGGHTKVFHYLSQAKSAPTFFNNNIKLYINGEEKFPDFLAAIKQATHHIHLEYYIFDVDQIGQEVINLLIQKANAGVEVRIIVDDLGASSISKKHKQLFKNTAVQFYPFLPVRFKSLGNSNYRNHRKILIVDGHTAFIGGINISDKYINTPPYNKKNKVYWRDTSIRIQGNSVDMLQLYFWLDWKTNGVHNFDISNDKYLYPTVPKTADCSKSIVSFAYSIPASDIPAAMEAMILAISQAQHSIQICTPYFIPSEEFKSALMIAVSSGVSVELMIPQESDSMVVQQASLSFLKPLIERGIKVYLYRQGFIHAKTIVIDQDLAFVGTVNLDNRSFFINFELTAVFHESVSIQRLRSQFEADISVSTLLTLEQWMSYPWYKRAFASLCRLLAPIL